MPNITLPSVQEIYDAPIFLSGMPLYTQEQVDSMLALYEEERRWIPTAERSPDNNEEVLLFLTTWYDGPIDTQLQGYYDGERWRHCFEDMGRESLFKVFEVTHWKPLPPSPTDQ